MKYLLTLSVLLAAFVAANLAQSVQDDVDVGDSVNTGFTDDGSSDDTGLADFNNVGEDTDISTREEASAECWRRPCRRRPCRGHPCGRPNSQGGNGGSNNGNGNGNGNFGNGNGAGGSNNGNGGRGRRELSWEGITCR